MSLTKVQINLGTTGNLSGSRSLSSGSFASRITTAETELTNTILSSSVQIGTDISGSFGGQRVGTTDSPTFNAITVGTATVTGTLTAQEIHSEFESASILFTSGSTHFGNSSDDIHNMTGSLNVSGGLSVKDGTLTVTDNVDFNGDLDVDGTSNLDVVDIDGAVTQDGGNFIINEAGANYDFRVESDGNTHAFVMDGAQGFIGMGASQPGYVNGNDHRGGNTQTTSGAGGLLHLEGLVPRIILDDTGDTPQFAIEAQDYFSILELADDSTTETTRFRIAKNTGNVGIGSSSPTAKLDVNGGATINGNTIVGRGGNQKGRLTVQSRTGTATRKTNAIVAVPYNDTSESICMIGMDGQSSNNEMHIGSNTSDFMSPTYIDFFTASDVNSQTNSRVMRMTSDQRVGIGTDTPSTATNVLLTVGSTGLGYAGMEFAAGTNAERWRLYTSYDGSSDAIFGIYRVSDSTYKFQVDESGVSTFAAGVVLDSSSDTLSRYDEGEATIYMYTANGNKDNAAWTNRSGYTKMSYVRVGDMVTCQGKFELQGQNNASTDNAHSVLFELPFTVYDGTDKAGECAGTIAVNRFAHGLTTSTMNGWYMLAVEGTTVAYIVSPSTQSETEQYLGGASDGNWEGQFSITYRTQ